MVLAMGSGDPTLRSANEPYARHFLRGGAARTVGPAIAALAALHHGSIMTPGRSALRLGRFDDPTRKIDILLLRLTRRQAEGRFGLARRNRVAYEAPRRMFRRDKRNATQ